MPRESKKKGVEPPVEKTLEELILDRKVGKYQLVALSSTWALVLRKREEHRHLTQTEILDLALRQVLTGEVDADEVKAQAARIAAESPGEGSEDAKEKSKKK